jgi:hypothetical protein
MSHTFVYQSAGDGLAVFRCTSCGTLLNFVLPGNGEPAAVADGDGWAMPEGWEAYVGDCNPEASVVPQVITRRQFLIQVVRSGMCTADEVATLPLQPPAYIAAIFASLSPEAALEASLTWATMTEVHRHDPLIDAAVAASLMTEADIDLFFAAAAAI